MTDNTGIPRRLPPRPTRPSMVSGGESNPPSLKMPTRGDRTAPVPPPYTGGQTPATGVPTPPPYTPSEQQQVPPPYRKVEETLSSSPKFSMSESDDSKDGALRCPSCGSTNSQPIVGTVELVCLHCRHRWTGERLDEKHGLSVGIDGLKGRYVASGSKDIKYADSVVTLACGGCGAEVVIDTQQNTNARCHWCRQNLSVNSQRVQNGAVPDGILPFALTREDAVAEVKKFTEKRKFFASKEFKSNFKPDNLMGVYLPYMVVDGNVRVRLDGEGEVHIRQYKRKSGKNTVTVYDADRYAVTREFNLSIDDVIVESSSERGHIDTKINTNNIINAILPFDVKKIVKFDSRYLGDFSSERRDMSIDEGIARRAYEHFLTIARENVNDTLSDYERRGVRWDAEQMDVHGTRWIAVYLPVWLYAHHETDKANEITHYIAVNGRNGTTMGSIPVNKTRLGLMSALLSLPILSTIPLFALSGTGG